jgi:glucosylceramidase
MPGFGEAPVTGRATAATPCCTGDVAANAVDGDASTRYSTGAGQAPGQYLQADFGK